jgi:hypothetical protein
MNQLLTNHISLDKMKPLGQDREGNNLYPGDTVLRDGDIEETIEYGQYREKFDCGYVVGYYIPDYCIKLNKEE